MSGPGTVGKVHELFVPGRLAVLGEHSDWACSSRSTNANISVGRCLVCVTNEGLYARAQALSPQVDASVDSEVHKQASMLKFRHVDSHGCEKVFSHPLQLDSLRAYAKGERESKTESADAGYAFFAYVAGTMAAVMDACDLTERTSGDTRTSTGGGGGGGVGGGIYIDNYKTSLPMKKGLSSSAAVCVLVARSCSAVWDLGLSQQRVMEIACAGERNTHSECGMMDFCVAMGAGQMGLMTLAEHGFFQLGRVVVKSPLYFVVADLMAGKDTVRILRDLNSCFPVPSTPAAADVHAYVQTSAWLVMDAVEAIETGGDAGVTALGAAMSAAQAAFDRGAMGVCPQELTSPRLHSVLQSSALKSVSVAAKGVGSQGDGSVQVLCASPLQQQQVLALLREELGCEAFPLTVPSTSGESQDKDAGGDGGEQRGRQHTQFVSLALVLCSEGGMGTGTDTDTQSCVDALLACGVRRVAVVAPTDVGSIDRCGLVPPSAASTCYDLREDTTLDTTDKDGSLLGTSTSAAGGFSYGAFLRGRRREHSRTHCYRRGEKGARAGAGLAAVEYLLQEEESAAAASAAAAAFASTAISQKRFRVFVVIGDSGAESVSGRGIPQALGFGADACAGRGSQAQAQAPARQLQCVLACTAEELRASVRCSPCEEGRTTSAAAVCTSPPSSPDADSAAVAAVTLNYVREYFAA